MYSIRTRYNNIYRVLLNLLVDQVVILREALVLSEATIQRDPEKLGLELTGRLLPFASEFQVIQDLIVACDNDAPNTIPVVPVVQVKQTNQQK